MQGDVSLISPFVAYFAKFSVVMQYRLAYDLFQCFSESERPGSILGSQKCLLSAVLKRTLSVKQILSLCVAIISNRKWQVPEC